MANETKESKGSSGVAIAGIVIIALLLLFAIAYYVGPSLMLLIFG